MNNNPIANIIKECFTEVLTDIDKDMLITRLDNNIPFYKLPLCQNDLRKIADKFKSKTNEDIFISYDYNLKECIDINITFHTNNRKKY
jgi:hypothetical protein